MVEGPKRLGALAEADQRRLEATEALAISEMEGPDGIHELLDEWSLHWQLRDAAQAAEERDAADPQEGFIYPKEDFQEWSSFNIAVWFPTHGGTKLQRYASGLHKQMIYKQNHGGTKLPNIVPKCSICSW